jgi:RecJ-like exonuclease
VAYRIDKNEYARIHYWIRKNYGKANKCESKNCTGITKDYGWALLKGKEYERNRDNFMMLCKSCHTKYDFTDETIKKLKSKWINRKVFNVKCKKCSDACTSYYDRDIMCLKCRRQQTKDWITQNKEQYSNVLKKHYLKNREDYLVLFKKRYHSLKDKK